MRSAFSLNRRAKTEWKVPMRMKRALGPTSFSIRSRISRAALLVKVRARIEEGSTPCANI